MPGASSGLAWQRDSAVVSATATTCNGELATTCSSSPGLSRNPFSVSKCHVLISLKLPPCHIILFQADPCESNTHAYSAWREPHPSLNSSRKSVAVRTTHQKPRVFEVAIWSTKRHFTFMKRECECHQRPSIGLLSGMFQVTHRKQSKRWKAKTWRVRVKIHTTLDFAAGENRAQVSLTVQSDLLFLRFSPAQCISACWAESTFYLSCVLTSAHCLRMSTNSCVATAGP